MVHQSLRMLGGFWWFLIGAPLAALALSVFVIPPPYNLTGSTLPNLWVIIQNPTTLPMPVLIFLGLWALITLGFGAGTAFRYSGKKRKLY